MKILFRERARDRVLAVFVGLAALGAVFITGAFVRLASSPAATGDDAGLRLGLGLVLAFLFALQLPPLIESLVGLTTGRGRRWRPVRLIVESLAAGIPLITPAIMSLGGGGAWWLSAAGTAYLALDACLLVIGLRSLARARSTARRPSFGPTR